MNIRDCRISRRTFIPEPYENHKLEMAISNCSNAKHFLETKKNYPYKKENPRVLWEYFIFCSGIN